MPLYHVNSFFANAPIFTLETRQHRMTLTVKKETAFLLKKVVHVKDKIHVFGNEDDFEHLN